MSRPRRLGRSALAIAAGFLSVAMLSIGVDVLLHAVSVYPPMGVRMSDRLFLLATAYRLAFTVLGGHTTARLAPARPMAHVWILGVIGLAAATAGAAATWGRSELGPAWYPIALVVTALPCVWAGGRLALWRMGRAAGPGEAGDRPPPHRP